MTTISSVSSLITSLGEIPPETVIFGHSETMQSLRERMDKVASANVPVLIQGESGTGKDIIARMIHARSPWRTGPFVKVNCPAIPGTLLESELFGYEKGAFTRSEEHTSELQSRRDLVCRLLLEKKKKKSNRPRTRTEQKLC